MYAALKRAFVLAGLLASALTVGACATVTGGTTQNMTVESDPQGATCTLSRDGQTIGAINASQQTLRIDRNKKDITVTCNKAGYRESSETVSSEFTGATLGNILVGGLIGIAIDASSGADNKYPENVTVLLLPERFESAAQRDAYFERIKQRINDNAKALIDKARSSCNVSKELCEQDVKKIEAARDQKLLDQDKRRAETDIGAPTPGQKAAAPPMPAPMPASTQPPPANLEAKLANKTPVSFASVAERNAWVDYQKGAAARQRDAEMQQLRLQCTSRVTTAAWESVCVKEIDAVLSKYNAEIARIEKLQSSIPVRA